MTKPLLVLDFSGTLSLEAVRFGTPDRLTSALQQSGLYRLGVDDTRYWNDLVIPTWIEGSTTRIGLKQLLARQLQMYGISPTVAMRTASRFTRAYMAASLIDPAWQPLFTTLRTEHRAIPLIATDHYAEATGQIADQLTGLQWTARALRWHHGQVRRWRVRATAYPDLAFIANSADLGTVKADPAFWQRVQSGIRTSISHVIVVDDFGASENLADFYANPARVEQRRLQTIAAIEQTFGVPVTTIWFTSDQSITQTVQEILNKCGPCADVQKIRPAPA